MNDEKVKVVVHPDGDEVLVRMIELDEDKYTLPVLEPLKLNPDVSQNMELVSILKNFKARIAQKVENSREDNGSRTDNFSQVVNSNLPKSFVVEMPIFKGRPVEKIEIELLADVDGRDVKLALCSPGAEVIVEEERNKAIDEQLSLIRSLAPDIAIIEQ